MHVKIFDNKYHIYILCAQSSELQYFSIEYKLDILKLNMKLRILSKQFTLKYSFFSDQTKVIRFRVPTV